MWQSGHCICEHVSVLIGFSCICLCVCVCGILRRYFSQFAFNQVGAWLAAKSRNRINNFAVARMAKKLWQQTAPKELHSKRAIEGHHYLSFRLPSRRQASSSSRHNIVIIIIGIGGFPDLSCLRKYQQQQHQQPEQHREQRIKRKSASINIK